MKKILIILFFAALALLFAWMLVKRSDLSETTEIRRSPRTVIPTDMNGNITATAGLQDAAAFDESRPQPLITLENNEIFLHAFSVDLNRDGVMDQVCALRKAGNPNVFLVVGIQNPITGEYSRLPEITTSITQARTLLLYSTDLIGDRSSPVLVSGMTSDNNYALSVYLPSIERNGTVSVVTIADLRSDGPITIREVERSDAYNRGVTSGESYAIYTYNSDPLAPDTLDQIERIYRWNRQKKSYEQVSESRIPGKRLETRLISQLQGATLETFEDFLTGLWYLPATTGRQGARYLFFDTPKREITFHSASVQEVFIRESGAPRRYGAYLTTRNKSISSIRRMIDIELTGIDEIRIKVLEDVKLKIGVASDWDGIYRKMSQTSFSAGDQSLMEITRARDFLVSSGGSWASQDGQKMTFSEQTYSLTTRSSFENGNYALMNVKEQLVLQLRSNAAEQRTSFFALSLSSGEKPEGKKSITLSEISLSMDGVRATGDEPVEFTNEN